MARDQVLQLRASAEQRQLIDQAAAAEGISRTEFILRSCQARARDVLLDRTLFSLTPELPGVNYVGGSRQLRRRVGAPTPLPWQGGGPRWLCGSVGG